MVKLEHSYWKINSLYLYDGDNTTEKKKSVLQQYLMTGDHYFFLCKIEMYFNQETI